MHTLGHRLDFKTISIHRVHVREVSGSSPFAPTFLLPWSGNQGIFVPFQRLVFGVERITDLTDRVRSRPLLEKELLDIPVEQFLVSLGCEQRENPNQLRIKIGYCD